MLFKLLSITIVKTNSSRRCIFFFPNFMCNWSWRWVVFIAAVACNPLPNIVCLLNCSSNWRKRLSWCCRLFLSHFEVSSDKSLQSSRVQPMTNLSVGKLWQFHWVLSDFDVCLATFSVKKSKTFSHPRKFIAVEI